MEGCAKDRGLDRGVVATKDTDIDKLYPEFDSWVHQVKGYATASGVYLIKLWHEWLKERNETKKVRRISQELSLF